MIFFVLLEILLAINFWHEYQVKKLEIEEKIQVEMKLCAYTIQCEGLQTDFVDKGKDKEENILYKDGDFYSYFSVPTAEKYLMKVVYPKSKYIARVKKLEEKLKHKFLIYSLFAALVSLLFSIYALMPLHRALRLNEEFDLKPLIHERVPYFELLYPDVTYHIDVIPFRIKANKDAFVRILDNLLSNAGKYNKKAGQVSVTLHGTLLTIEDTGKGIAEPSKVFKRYYKEQDRGIGIGLHIVKKLCDEMHIGIKIKSNTGQGTRVLLDISRVMA